MRRSVSKKRDWRQEAATGTCLTSAKVIDKLADDKSIGRVALATIMLNLEKWTIRLRKYVEIKRLNKKSLFGRFILRLASAFILEKEQNPGQLLSYTHRSWR